MLTALPSRIMNYKVSAASPTDELITIGRILAEVGDCAGSVLDSEHLSFARRCASRLGKIVDELKARKAIRTPDDLYEIHNGGSETVNLADMSIDGLYNLYRRWPLRRRERIAKGLDALAFGFEGRIVGELERRCPATRDEQFKIDYCLATYSNELECIAMRRELA